MRDILAQQMFGEHAIYRIGKLVIQKTSDGKNTLIAGAVVPAIESIDEREMWECEIYIVPRRKRRLAEHFRGERIDQVLTAGYENPENWGAVYDDTAPSLSESTP